MKFDMSNPIIKSGLMKAFGYIGKDPVKNLPKLMEWVDKFAGKDYFKPQRDVMRAVINDPDNNMHRLLCSIYTDIDSEVLKTTFRNFVLNSVLIGWSREEELRAEYGCNIPWAILLDPTSACNLHCTGCWAAEYGNRLNLSFDEIDSIITQGKQLGVYFYIYTGGEPLIRKSDLLKICRKHNDCEFMTFTNGTLIDESFADNMLDVRNLIPVLSVEGFEKATDSRRGKGTYRRVTGAMEILKRKRLPFGISCCYTSENCESISSNAYFDQMIEWGAKFVWYFHYMPVGNDAAPSLLPTPEQREHIYRKIRSVRREKPIFAMDFQNDGEYVGGCVAGGRRYLHINANGDADPCVFIHYSDSNIREKTLLEILRSPLFMAYHNGQPFNENHLRPCPMLENPEKLREIVKKSGAHSTDMQSPENVEQLCGKCDNYARSWAPTAERLWKNQNSALPPHHTCRM